MPCSPPAAPRWRCSPRRTIRDIYTIQGNDRGEIFSIHWRKPKPLVAIPDTFVVNERISAKGEVETRSTSPNSTPLIAAVKARGYEAIAICFLFGFKNPAHELAAEAYLRERLPGRVDHAIASRVAGVARIRAHLDDGHGRLHRAGDRAAISTRWSTQLSRPASKAASCTSWNRTAAP